MSNNSTTIPDRYALVSSLYGPGTTACWYFTAASCFISWALNPKKRLSGSIDNDFIALLTLPVVAAAHLISQIRNFISMTANTGANDNWTLQVQQSAAMEASLNITDNFMGICMGLVLLATYFQCGKRAILLALVGSLCFFAELYFTFRSGGYNNADLISRLFLFHFNGLLVSMGTLLGLLVIAIVGYLFIFFCASFAKLNPNPSRLLNNDANDIVNKKSKLERIDFLNFLYLHRGGQLMAIMSWAMLLIVVIPISTNSVVFTKLVMTAAKNEPPSAIATLVGRFLHNVFPSSSIAITDLDQSVAVFAGVVTLCFSLYGAGKPQYVAWRAVIQENLCRDRADEFVHIRLQRMIDQWENEVEV